MKVDVYVDVTMTVVMVESSLLVLGAAIGDQAVWRVPKGALGMRGSGDVRGSGLGAGVVGSSLVAGVGSWLAVTALARMRGSEDVRGSGLDAGVVGSWSAVTSLARILGLLGIAVEDVLVVGGTIAAS